MKLALGTVQFGLNYGVSNHDGQVSFDECKKILDVAKESGITLIDSSAQYGSSETRLGLLKAKNSFDICTKLPKLHKGIDIEELVAATLKRLDTKQINTLMFHDVAELLGENGDFFINDIERIKSQGLIQNIGVSVYHPEELKLVSERYSINQAQIPANCIDQRFIKSNTLTIAKKKGIDIHCRSAFLQGLLLIPKNLLQPYFHQFNQTLESFYKLCKQYSVSPLVIALSAVINEEYFKKIIVGCCSHKELIEIVNAYNQAKSLDIDFTSTKSDDENLLLPQNWQLGV